MPETPTVSKQGCPRLCLPLVVSRHRRSLHQRRTKGGDEAAGFPTILDGHRRRAERFTALAIVVHRTSKCPPTGWFQLPQVTPLAPMYVQLRHRLDRTQQEPLEQTCGATSWRQTNVHIGQPIQRQNRKGCPPSMQNSLQTLNAVKPPTKNYQPILIVPLPMP